MLSNNSAQKISISQFSQDKILSVHRFDSASACQYCKLRKTCIASEIEQDINSNSHHINHHSSLVNQGEHLYFSGDPLEAIYIVKSGAFKSYLINSDGHEQIVDFHLPGDILGFDAIAAHHFESTAVALERSSICTLPVSQIEHLIKELVPNWFMTVLTSTLNQQQRNISVLGKKDAKARLAAFLWDMSKNLQSLGFSKKNLRLNMSRQDIGNYLGLASETISRIFTKLQQDGVLEIDKREIKIIDFDLLSDLADKDCTNSQPKSSAHFNTN